VSSCFSSLLVWAPKIFSANTNFFRRKNPCRKMRKIIQNHTHTTKKHSLLRDDTTHFIRRETMSNDGSTNASLFFVAGSCVGMLVRRSFFFILFKLNHNENNKFVRSRSLVVCYYCFY